MLAGRESNSSMTVLAGGAQLQTEDFCESISELLWVLLWPGLRIILIRRMGGDQIVR